MRKIIVLVVAALVFCAAAQAQMRIGVETNSVPGGFGTVATIGTEFNETLSGDLGLALATNAAGENTNVGLLARLDWKVMKIGQLIGRAGLNLMFASNPNYQADGDSVFTINGYAGVEYFITKNLSVLADIILLELTTSGGDSSFALLSGSANGTGRSAASATIYSGARLYL